MPKWKDKADIVAADTKTALQTLYDSLPKGQQKQIEKVPEVKTLFDRYGVEYSETIEFNPVFH